MARPVLRTLSIMLTCTICSVCAEDDRQWKGVVASSEKMPKLKLKMRKKCAPELGLVNETENSAKYAKTAQSFCNASSPYAEKNLRIREVIGFTAPWVNRGYTAAKYIKSKLSGVSPLWFKVMPPRKEGKSASNESFEIFGLDFAKKQQAWVNFMISEGVEVLHHVSLEGFESLKMLKDMMKAPQPLAEKVAEVCDEVNNSGIVFDVRLALFSSVKPLLPPLLEALGTRLHAAGRRFLLSVPAEPQAEQWNAPEFDAGDALAMAPHIDAVIVGTRDYSRNERGPTAPMPWVRSSIKRLLITESAGSDGFRPDQLLIEIPLYGRAFKDTEVEGKVIFVPELVKALGKEKPKLVWDTESAEHSADIQDGKVYMSVPTLAFVRDRLRLAHTLGVGVVLRELGSGFDSAFDLLTARTPPPESETASSRESEAASSSTSEAESSSESEAASSPAAPRTEL